MIRILLAALMLSFVHAATAVCLVDGECLNGTRCCPHLNMPGYDEKKGECYDPSVQVCVHPSGDNPQHPPEARNICPKAQPAACGLFYTMYGANCYDPAGAACLSWAYGNKICPQDQAHNETAELCFGRCTIAGKGVCCYNSCGGEDASYCPGTESQCCGICGACASSSKAEECCTDPADPNMHAWACSKTESCGTWVRQCAKETFGNDELDTTSVA